MPTNQRAGNGNFELFEFAGRRPDGAAVKFAFALAFASDLHAPQTGFFTSQHRYPENFWNPVFQQHPNGAKTVARRHCGRRRSVSAP